MCPFFADGKVGNTVDFTKSLEILQYFLILDTIEDAGKMGIKSFWSWWSNSKLQQEITKQRNQLTNNSI